MAARTLKLRPHGQLFRQVLFACLAFMVPVFVVLYSLTIPGGAWHAVMVGQVIATGVVLIASVGYFGAAIWVSEHEIYERGYFGRMKRMSRTEIGSILRVETLDGSSVNTLPQLFVRDHVGRQQFRMRGQFWTRESMDALVEALAVPVENVEESVSASELRDDYPTLLYWFERHPVVASALFASFIVLLATTLILLFEGGAIYLSPDADQESAAGRQRRLSVPKIPRNTSLTIV